VLSEIFDFTGKGDDLLPHKIIHQASKAQKADCTWSSVQIFKTLVQRWARRNGSPSLMASTSLRTDTTLA
jgi:hypothetical protein